MSELPPKKVTVQEIAAIANVSVATVSRAMSRPDKVSEKTRQQVMRAVEATGYTINEAARNLRRQKTDTIVMLLPNIGNSLFSNIVDGVEHVCAENNISVLIADTQKASMTPFNARSYFSRNRADGVIVLDGLMPLDVINSGSKTSPVVFAGEWNDAVDVPVVRIDDEHGVNLAVEHLYQLGHRRIGQVAGPLTHTPGRVRNEAFQRAVNGYGLDPGNTWMHEGDFSLASGDSAAAAWCLLPKDQRPTAVMCMGDEMAFGFMAGVNKRGFRVPADVSVVGFDDLQLAAYYVPSLTTIHQPRKMLGTQAAKTLLSLIDGKQSGSPETIEPWLVVRDSTQAV